MDKCKIFKIIQLSILLFGLTEKRVLAEEMDSQEENVATEEDEESDFEPMKELPDVRPICPNLNRALDLSVNKYKVQRVKIYEPILKNFKIGVETSSLCKDLWYVIAKRKEKNRDYNFDFHGRIGMLWRGNFYIGGDGGFSTGKDCIWEGEDEYESKKKEDKKSEYPNAHLSRGWYANAMIGYNYVFDKNNDVLFAVKFGWSRTTIEKLKDRTCASGNKTECQPCWIGFLIAIENKLWGSPVFWGFDFQMNYLLNKKDIDGLKNYFIPDYGHSKYKVNFGFNIFLGLKFDFKQEIIIP